MVGARRRLRLRAARRHGRASRCVPLRRAMRWEVPSAARYANTPIRQYAIRDTRYANTRYAVMSRERDAFEGSPKCRAGLGKPDVNRAGASESVGFVESVGSREAGEPREPPRTPRIHRSARIQRSEPSGRRRRTVRTTLPRHAPSAAFVAPFSSRDASCAARRYVASSVCTVCRNSTSVFERSAGNAFATRSIACCRAYG